MQSLDEKEWREFDFAEIFDIKKGFYNKKPEDSGNGTIPFLGATDSNNGVTRFLTLDEIANSTKTGVLPNFPLDKKLFPGHAIAVTNNGSVGHAYYQATPFTCSHDINPLYLRDHEMSRDEADFLIKAIEEQGKLFQYARKWRPIRMVKSKLMLPVTDSGEPDYAYMAEYAQQKRDTMLAKYRAYVEARIAELGEVAEIPALDEKEWKPFSIVDLFSSIIPGKGKGLNHLKKVCADGVNYIGATNRNNGVLCYVEEDTYSRSMILEGNCIGFIKNGDGSAGFAIYKAEQFISTSDVLYGYADWLNKFTGLFFVVAQDKIEHKYSHGYKRNKEHLAGDKVMLPVTDSSEPDYEYMEQYSKNMMLRKYQQYLTFLQQRSGAR